MNGDMERIPLRVDVQRVIEVLASQIYQSPHALLRENTQNAFDALLMRLHQGDDFEPAIVVEVTPTVIRISDNGIGMTYEGVRDNFWQAGSSSKNTPEARAAGVVGTFGIGAMANFGVASRLKVVTESATSGERTETSADRATLSTHEECIEIISQLPEGTPGTIVTAEASPSTPIDVFAATSYITEFVRYVAIPVTVNGILVSQKPFESQWPGPQPEWSDSGKIALPGGLSAIGHVRAGANGQLWINITEVHDGKTKLDGRLLLSQGTQHLRTLRSGFGLATVGVLSVYGFGGVVDLPMLQPTAGREALSDHSMQLLQGIVQSIESWISERFADQPISNMNVQFIEWTRRNGRTDLCGQLQLTQVPTNEKITLVEVRHHSTPEHPMHFYAGRDDQVVRAFSSEESPLLVGSRRNPRRACEQAYLSQYCHIAQVSEGPSLIETYSEGIRPLEELAIAHRVSDTLERDYFLPTEVVLGRITHNVPALVVTSEPVPRIALDPSGHSFSVLKELYTNEYSAFGSFAKDFVRTVVFPQIENLVPSSTREGATAFLKRIRSKTDLFEYELADRQHLESIWADYYRGDITFEEATIRSHSTPQRSVQIVSSSADVTDIVPDLVTNQENLPGTTVGQPLPAIHRPEVKTDAPILTIGNNNPALNGFHCFLALSDRVTAEKGSFFLQPHSTTVLWGGQKVLFIFQHHSDVFGLYYDVQSDELVSPQSGGGEYPTSTLMLGSRVFIPVPEPIHASFIPTAGTTKRLVVRGEVLHSRPGSRCRA